MGINLEGAQASCMRTYFPLQISSKRFRASINLFWVASSYSTCRNKYSVTHCNNADMNCEGQADLVIFADSDNENNSGDVVEAVDPLPPLIPLAADIVNPAKEDITAGENEESTKSRSHKPVQMHNVDRGEIRVIENKHCNSKGQYSLEGDIIDDVRLRHDAGGSCPGPHNVLLRRLVARLRDAVQSSQVAVRKEVLTIPQLNHA